jgi:[CysO sulfur-carrier protein]-S-L-cysteine hydrolase
MPARSFVQDSGAPAWLSTAARDFRRSQTSVSASRSGAQSHSPDVPVEVAHRAPSLTAVLKIAREHVDAMIAHAREDHPDEACGVIVGSEGTDVPTRLVRMINADRSPTFFRFDPQEQFELYKTMSAAGEEIVVVYHSHTSTEAYPSRTDITLAAEPQAHYVLVSTADSGAADGPVSVRSYRIVDGVVTEEEIDVTE